MLTPGKILLHLYYRPLGRIRSSLQNGGPFAERETERQRQQMEEQASKLPPLPILPGKPLQVHLMTGRRFWYQTVFCLHSLQRWIDRPLAVDLYDDGTIDQQIAAKLAVLGPALRSHSIGELRANLDRHLPAAKFPVLRERWEKYPNIRKLIDVHLGSSGWKLVLDSDLLFFRRADALLRWHDAPDSLLHAIDCTESYGYTRPLMESLAGGPVPRLLNVGICGLRGESLDWEQLERWTAELQRAERTNYYLEQALVAMLAVTSKTTALAADDYITLPSRDEVMHPRAVMHHYVANAKRWYFRHGWRHVGPPITVA